LSVPEKRSPPSRATGRAQKNNYWQTNYSEARSVGEILAAYAEIVRNRRDVELACLYAEGA